MLQQLHTCSKGDAVCVTSDLITGSDSHVAAEIGPLKRCNYNCVKTVASATQLQHHIRADELFEDGEGVPFCFFAFSVASSDWMSSCSSSQRAHSVSSTCLPTLLECTLGGAARSIECQSPEYHTESIMMEARARDGHGNATPLA